MSTMEQFKTWVNPTYKYIRHEVSLDINPSGIWYEKVLDKEGYYSYNFNKDSAIEYVRYCNESEFDEIVYNIEASGTWVDFVIRELCQRREWIFDYFKSKKNDLIKDYSNYSDYLFYRLHWRYSSIVSRQCSVYSIYLYYKKVLQGSEFECRVLNKDRLFFDRMYVESQMYIIFNVYDGDIGDKIHYDNLLTMISDVEQLGIAK